MAPIPRAAAAAALPPPDLPFRASSRPQALAPVRAMWVRPGPVSGPGRLTGSLPAPLGTPGAIPDAIPGPPPGAIPASAWASAATNEAWGGVPLPGRASGTLPLPGRASGALPAPLRARTVAPAASEAFPGVRRPLGALPAPLRARAVGPAASEAFSDMRQPWGALSTPLGAQAATSAHVAVLSAGRQVPHPVRWAPGARPGTPPSFRVPAEWLYTPALGRLCRLLRPAGPAQPAKRRPGQLRLPLVPTVNGVCHGLGIVESVAVSSRAGSGAAGSNHQGSLMRDSMPSPGAICQMARPALKMFRCSREHRPGCHLAASSAPCLGLLPEPPPLLPGRLASLPCSLSGPHLLRLRAAELGPVSGLPGSLSSTSALCSPARAGGAAPESFALLLSAIGALLLCWAAEGCCLGAVWAAERFAPADPGSPAPSPRAGCRPRSHLKLRCCWRCV